MTSFATKFSIGSSGGTLVEVSNTTSNPVNIDGYVVITNPIDDYGNIYVNLNNNLKIGDAYGQVIDNTERILDLTFLAGPGYPMDIELEARDVACYVRQGGASVSLDGTYNARISADQWRKINVANENEAYIAVKNITTDETGTLIAVRLDKVG